MSQLRAGLVLAAFAALTLPLMPMQQLFLWVWPSMARRFPMHYHRLVCRIIGVRLQVIGTPPGTGPALIASNHASWLDIVVLSAVAPVSFVAKREVNTWPFFGSLARLQRTVFVDRDRRHATGSARETMRRRLTAGDILVLFPEGTSTDGRRVLPFKSAFFGAADLEGVAVHPVSVAYSGHRNLPMTRRLRPFYAWYGDMALASHLWSALASGPIEATVVYHPPLASDVTADRKHIARLSEEAVRRGLVLALHDAGKMG